MPSEGRGHSFNKEVVMFFNYKDEKTVKRFHEKIKN
jgi:hypothetical protein